MSELNNAQPSETTEVHEAANPATENAATETALPETVQRKRYTNKTACLLNGVYLTMLIASIVYIGLQCYLSVTTYLAQMAPIEIAILYTFASILMPAIMMIAGSFIFKFFAEVVELLDKKRA